MKSRELKIVPISSIRIIELLGAFKISSTELSGIILVHTGKFESFKLVITLSCLYCLHSS